MAPGIGRARLAEERKRWRKEKVLIDSEEILSKIHTCALSVTGRREQKPWDGYSVEGPRLEQRMSIDYEVVYILSKIDEKVERE